MRQRFYRVRFVRGHDDRVARLQMERFARDLDLGFTVQHMQERVIRRGVFAQLLLFIKRKQGDVASLRFGDLAADDRTVPQMKHAEFLCSRLSPLRCTRS